MSNDDLDWLLDTFVKHYYTYGTQSARDIAYEELGVQGEYYINFLVEELVKPFLPN